MEVKSSKPIEMNLKEYEELTVNEKEVISRYFDYFALAPFNHHIRLCLRRFAEGTGYVIDDNWGCIFPGYFLPQEEGFLGDTGVYFFFEYPICDTEHEEYLISNKAFLKFLQAACERFTTDYPETKTEVNATACITLLETVKTKWEELG